MNYVYTRLIKWGDYIKLKSIETMNTLDTLDFETETLTNKEGKNHIYFSLNSLDLTLTGL